MIGKKVIIRADRAGVFYGVLKEKNGSELVTSWEGNHSMRKSYWS